MTDNAKRQCMAEITNIAENWIEFSESNRDELQEKAIHRGTTVSRIIASMIAAKIIDALEKTVLFVQSPN